LPHDSQEVELRLILVLPHLFKYQMLHFCKFISTPESHVETFMRWPTGKNKGKHADGSELDQLTC
jgi:hypothetical protein